jgi:hypothetical protein
LAAGSNQGIDNDDTTATVLKTTDFAASGTVYIGTEAIGYSSKTATTLTGLMRGKFSPFGVSGGTRFGHQHRVRVDANSVSLQPEVTDAPRNWPDRWGALWLHRFDESTGLMNTKADAQVVFAGRVAEITDDPASMCSVIEIDHVLDVVKDAVLGHDMWSATITEGMELQALWEFSLIEDVTTGGVTTTYTANPLMVVGVVTGANQIASGVYSAAELCSAVATWFAGEMTAGRINGKYDLGLAPYGPDGFKTHTYFSANVPTGDTFRVEFRMPWRVSKFLGDLITHVYNPDPTSALVEKYGHSATDYDVVSEHVPKRNEVDLNTILFLDEERGTFDPQASTTLPIGAFLTPTSTPNAVFMVNDRYLLAGYKNGAQITQISPMTPSAWGDENDPFNPPNATRLDDGKGPLTIRQVFMTVGPLATVIKCIFCSTGTNGYNHATYDVYPASMGLGIPFGMLTSDFLDSCDALPGSDAPITLILTKPTQLTDILNGDLILRHTFLRWKDQHLEWKTWKTPTTAGVALTEANKASSGNDQEEQRSPTRLVKEWQRQIVKVQFNRDITQLDKDGDYKGFITFEDPTAVDAAGRAVQTQTVNAQNTYQQEVGQGAGIEALKDQFKALAPIVMTRPIRKITRSVDSTLFEQIGAGDDVLVSDNFARDPDTGRRGITARPGIVLFHRWTLGGAKTNADDSPANGEVEVLFFPNFRIALYAPAAQLDDTSTNAGYVVATKTLTCYPHAFSESSEAADASWFSATRAVRILEMDPSDPAAPSSHDDIVASQTGNAIVLTTGFAAFDNTKRYVVVFDDYTDSIAAQQAGFSYQADDADAKIQDARAPFQYSVAALPPGTYTANAAGDSVVLPPNASYGDGVGRDVAFDRLANNLARNLIDYKTAHCSPNLSPTEMSGAAVTGTWRLVEIRPIHLTADRLPHPSCKRALQVAPYMKSSDGTSASVRVTLSTNAPLADSLNDVDRGPVLADATFTTTGGYDVATPQSLDISNHKQATGVAYLLIECSVKARTRGLAVCQEGPRT